MKNLSLAFSSSTHAGRSGETDITDIVIKSTHVEIYTLNTGICGPTDRWHLDINHDNYQVLVSGFLATKAASKKVDIVGDGSATSECPDAELIDWAYVLK